MRLADGDNESEGRVEVCLSRTWGTISDFRSFNGQAAKVVCGQLGYSDKGSVKCMDMGMWNQVDVPMYLYMYMYCTVLLLVYCYVY